MIDAQLAFVEWAQATLGEGIPTAGDQYRGVAQRLGLTAATLTEAVAAAPWEGLSGVVFSTEIQRLIGAVKIIGEVDETVAAVLDHQASAVELARWRLAHVRAELVAARLEVVGLAVSGNLVGAEALEQGVAANAQNFSTAATNDLYEFSAQHANMVTNCHERLDEYFATYFDATEATTGSLVGGSASSSSAGSALCVTPEMLIGMARSLWDCSFAVVREISMGERILAEVRATHGRGGYVELFDSSLAAFAHSHCQAIWEVFTESDAHAVRLQGIAATYIECDAGAAESMQSSPR